MNNPIRPVHVPDVGGVKVRRHVLDREAARLAGITQRLGKRLSYWLRTRPVHELPDDSWHQSYALYGRMVMDLLREQRERAKLTPAKGGQQLTDEELEAGLAKLKVELLGELTDADLAAELQRRAIARS